jgi:LmbE family N-acetylglucosaminyl deacetylase
LIELQSFGVNDRVLVVAPHPDDESIATGGALQAARAAGAACRVLIVTDGDNNPWPQRWVEKRWRIGAVERARWGARRRAEAIAALNVLGIARGDVRCFGLPDLGLTDALMRGQPDVVALLREQIEEFRPTRIFLPALEDRHPDHSALHVLTRLALAGPHPILSPQAREGEFERPAAEFHPIGAGAELFTFGVHGVANPDVAVVVTLSEAQRETKRRAILQHTTQMRLSRRRFVGYAKAKEPFRTSPHSCAADPLHPLQGVVTADGHLLVKINHARWGRSLRDLVLFVVAGSSSDGWQRRQVALSGVACGHVIDTAANRRVGAAAIDRIQAETSVSIAVEHRVDAGWVKLARPAPGLFVFDRHGWQTIASRETEQGPGAA